MTKSLANRCARPLLTLSLAAGVCTPGLTRPNTTGASLSSAYPQDIPFAEHDTDTKLYQAANRLRLYNAPVGYALTQDPTWYRDTTVRLNPGSRSLEPARLPFRLVLAPPQVRSSMSATVRLAQLFDSDGHQLEIDLESSPGALASVTTPRVLGSVVTLPDQSVPTAGAGPGRLGKPTRGIDVQLHPTVAGLDVRLLIKNPRQAGSYVLTLNPDHQLQTVQDPNNVIRINQLRPIYGDDGAQHGVASDGVFIVNRPVVRDSSADPVAQGTTGPVSMALLAAPEGRERVSLTLDNAWLNDLHRVFPVQVDLPLSTAQGTSESDIFGTLNSCAPDDQAPLSRVMVGSTGACTYHGFAHFDLTTLPYAAAIQSATLNLYTPDHTRPTGIVAYPHLLSRTTDKTIPAPYAPYSWNTAPVVAAKDVGIPQTASNGHWQSWDITGYVQSSKGSGSATNGGITLVGPAAPIIFASPLGTGDDPPQDASYLCVTLSPGPLSDHFCHSSV